MKKVLTFFLLWRVSLLALAAISLLILAKKPSFDHFFNYWLWWDGLHYIGIAKFGYKESLDYAFFPLLPFITRFFYQMFPFGNLLFWGLLVSNACTAAAIVVLFKLIAKQYGQAAALRSTALLLTFPSAFFLGAFYTEGMFLLLAVTTFYFALQRKWAQASIIAALATATRPVGIVVCLALFVEYFASVQFDFKKITRQVLWLAASPLGFFFYLVYLFVREGDPWLFFKAQAVWHRSLSLYPWEVFGKEIEQIIALGTTNGPFLLSRLADLLSSLVFLLLLIPVFKKLPLSYFVYAYGVILIPLLTGATTSMFRFVLVAFPMFIIMGLWSKHWLVFTSLLFLQSLLLAVFTLLFIAGFWVA